jgi:hypothetical protein
MSVTGDHAGSEANIALTVAAATGWPRVNNSRNAACTCVSLSLAARYRISKYSLSA